MECLEDAGLDASIDVAPYPSLPEQTIERVRRCHQGLYNAARTNPQIKGSNATQQWLTHEVLSGTQAKPFAVPATMGTPH